MNTKAVLIVALIISGFSYNLYAQNRSLPSVSVGDGVSAMYFEGGIAASELFSPRYVRSQGKSIQGSPFVSDLFTEGTIVIKSKNLLEDKQSLDCKLRFNAYTNEFEFLNQRDTLLISNPDLIEFIKVGEDKFVYTLCSPKKSFIEAAYMVVLVEGDVQLLERYKCVIDQNLSVPYYMGGNGDGSYFYKVEKELYFKIGNQNAVKIPYSINTLTKVFHGNSKEAKTVIKNEKLKVRKNREDMIQLFESMNKLN